MKTLHLWAEPLQENDGEVTAAITVERIAGGRERLWYRLPVEHQTAVTSSADPFVIGAIFLIMEEAAMAGGPVQAMVHGAVSPSLIRNLEEFQIAWSIWRPEAYGRAEIRAEKEIEVNEGPSEEAAVMCFSGGLDSAFTAYRHTTPGVMRYPRQLQAGVMVQLTVRLLA